MVLRFVGVTAWWAAAANDSPERRKAMRKAAQVEHERQLIVHAVDEWEKGLAGCLSLYLIFTPHWQPEKKIYV